MSFERRRGRNLFILLKPTLQAVCWLIDVTLSLDPALQVEMPSRPSFNLQAIDLAIKTMQSQINELAEQRHQIELSMVSICITHIFLALVRLTVQLGLQLHIGVIFTLCDVRILEPRTLFQFPCSGSS